MLRNTLPTDEEEPLLKWRGLEGIFGWDEEELEEERKKILKAPRYYEQLLSYIRRPAEAVKGGIEAAIEKEPVLPAIKGGLTGEEETKGRDILDALGIPLDDPDWVLNHPVQHFLVEMGGAGLEFVTDPVIWALWFAPGTKVLKGTQRYLARKEITKFGSMLKKDLSGVVAPGARKVLLGELRESPRYGKYLTKSWFREIAKHFKGTEYAPVFSVPAKMTPQSLELLPKFAPLAAKAGGIIPKIGTSEYIRYWDRLSPSDQKLELERKKALEVAPKEALFPEAEMPRTKQMQMYKQELETLRKAGMTGKAAEKEAMMRAAEKFKKLEEKKPVAEQLKWELGAPTIKGQREIEFVAPELAPKVEVQEEPYLPIPFDVIADREGPIMADAMRKFESAGVDTIQSNLGGAGTYRSLQSTSYDKTHTYVHFSLYDEKTINKLQKSGFDLMEGPQYIDLGRDEVEDIRQLRVSFEIPSGLSPKQVDTYNTQKLTELLHIMKRGTTVDKSKAPKIPHYEEVPPKVEEELNIASEETFSLSRRLEANPDDPVLLALRAQAIYEDLGRGITYHDPKDAEADLGAAKKFNKELYGDSAQGKMAIEMAEEAKVKFEAPEIAPKPKKPYPTAKEVVKELSTEIRTKQNTDIEEAILTTGIPPDSLKQGLYVYNHTGKSITEPDKRIRAFEKLLEKNNPVAYKALSTGVPQISIEEVSLKMTTLDKEVARLNKGADTEFNSVRDFIYKEAFPEEVKTILGRVKEHGGIKYSSAMKDYPEEWKQMPVSAKRKGGLPIDEMADELKMDIEDLVGQLAQYKARPKPSDFDVEVYEVIERNLGDFPNYMKRMELLDQRDRYQSALLELRARGSAPEPEALADQREVKIEPSPKLEEERITPLVEKLEEEKPIADVMSMEMERIRAIEQMKLKFGDVVSEKGATPPRDVGFGLEPPIKGEQLFLDVIPPDEIPVDIEPWPTSNKDVGALGWLRRVDYLFSDYQQATGVPIYSEGYKPIADASKMMRREEITLRGTLAQILRGIPKDRRIAIGKAMEGKEVELSDREKAGLEAMRNFYKFLGKEFGLSETEMIEDYLPRIMVAFRGGDPGLMPAEMEAWFKKHRIGELRWKKEDPLEITRIYIHAGLRDKYLYDSRLIPDFVKHVQNLPFGIKSKARFWLTHKILRHPTRFDAEIAGSMENIPGVEKALNKWGVDSTVAVRQITRGVSQCLYAGGIGFRVISAGKNVTQQTHNIAILGPKYWIRGLINCPKKEEREVIESLNILRKYGAELERRGIDNPASVPQQIADAGNFLFRKVDSLNRRVCLTGTREMVSDAHELFDKGKIDKPTFLKRTKFDLLPFGRRPEAIELFNKGDIEGYANVLGEEFVKLGQYTYEAEDMPLLFSGSTGRLASVFMSWPIEYIEMQAHFVKTGHWENILYYYLAATAVQNGLRYAGIETNPYGYGDVKIGDHRISLVPGGWFLLGSIPTSFSPAIQILYTGGRVAAVYLKGGSDRYLNEVKQEFLRSTGVLAPFKIAGSDIIQAIEEIQSGTYGKRDKNGRLMYISDETEVILRGLGFTTVEEAERRYREPIYEFGEEERKLGEPSPIRREAPSWWETH